MRRFLLAATVAVASGCGDLQHENPYDPQAPAQSQARTSLAGTVSLEAVGGVAPSLAGISVGVAGQSYTAVTDSAGHYVITGVPAGTYTIQAVLADYDTASATGVTATLDTGGRTVTVPDLALRRVRAQLRGTVSLRLPNSTVETSGGASVSLSAGGATVAMATPGAAAAAQVVGSAVTSPSGDFVIPDVPAPVGSYTLTATRLGYVTQTTTVTFQDGAFVVQTVQLQIDPGAIVGTAVVRGAADSSSDVTVRARGATLGGTPWEATLTSAADGTFRLSGLPAGTYGVTFERGDLVTASAGTRAVLPGADTAVGTVEVLAATGALAGVVQLPSAASSAGVIVTATGTAGTASTVTDAAGAYTLSGLPVGPYAVTATRAPEWQPATVSDAASVVRDQTTTLATASLSPWATAALSGLARLEGATDHSGTTVTLTGSDFRGVAVAPSTTPTAGSGAWSFTGLRAGSYQVAFSHADFDTPPATGLSIVTGQTASAGTLTLAASRGTLRGTVTAEGTTALAGTVVELSGPDTATAVSGNAGEWLVTGLRVGTYTATYRRAGYVTQSPPSVAVGAGTVADVASANLLLQRGAITGVARVARPTDAASSALIAVSLTGIDLNGAQVSASTMTVAGGLYTLPLLPQGTYALRFTKAHYDDQLASGIAVAAGASATAPDVTLPVSTGAVTGRIVLVAGDAAGFVPGSDLSGVIVTLVDPEGAATVAPAVTDAAGTYRFDGVPVQTSGLPYAVSAQKAGYKYLTGAGGAVVPAPGTTITVTPSPLTLTVDVGSVAGNVAVDDTGTKAAPANGAVNVALSGTAFNATAFSASADNVGSAFTLANIPAGSYTLVATSTGRTCTTGVTMPVTVSAGQPKDLAQVPPTYTFVCTDAEAPTGVSLGVPQGAGAQPGFTAATNVDVPVVVHASDANLAGYQYVTGAVPDWSSAPTTAGLVDPIPFPAGTLSSDGTWTLWVRAVDQVGNAGPASSVQVVRDATRPADVVLTTARSFVNDTTTTALVASGADANFRSYQSCVHLLANATGACPAASPSPPCTMADGGATVTVSFASANTKACVYAQSSDQAGNTSANVQRVQIVSDLMPPTAPIIAPLYDPSILSVHAESVDFFVVSGATDAPAGGTTPWKNVAWLEVDVGGGFLPLCPFAACRNASNVYNPCSCSCTDTRLVCDGTTFKAIRVPLLDGAANVIGVRAVDLAGNVGSGATQQVPTSTSLYPVAVAPDRENLPRGLGRLIAHRSTDSDLRLRDIGPDGKPGTADDVACDVGATGAWGCVVHRIAVLGPQLVIHADGDATLNARRPGSGGRFCAVDDTTYAFYAIPGTTRVWSVTGSYNHGRSGEYAAWLERDPVTDDDTVKVQAPNAWGRLAHEVLLTYCTLWSGGTCLHWVTLYTDPPAPVTLLSPGTSAVRDLREGGDCLLVELAASPHYQVACKAGGLGDATDVTFWSLPASAAAASLSADGTQLAWVEQDGTTLATRLHVRSAGPDRLYGTADDGDATRLGPGSFATPVSMAIDGGHVVVSESLYQGSYWLLHWNAGPDAVFDGAAAADDTVSRVLPSSVRRDSLSLLVGPQVAYSVESDGGNLSDVLTLDLSTFRWETVESADFSDVVTNGAGILFFHRGGTLTARLPSGVEQPAGFSASYLAATGTHLLTSSGGSVSVREFTPAGGFGAPTLLYSGTNYGVTAGGRWGLMATSEGGTRYRVSDLSAPAPVTTLLPVIAGTSPNTNGFGISDALVAYQCNHSGWTACIHQVGADGIFGTDDDVTLVLNHAGALPEYGAYGLAVGGDKVAFNDGTNMMVVGPGPDGLFNTADDVVWNLGPIGTSTMGNIAVAGNFAAWLRTTSNGEQVMYADLALGITRQLTTHYSNKVNLALDPSGRLTWIDYAFTTPALFVYAP